MTATLLDCVFLADRDGEGPGGGGGAAARRVARAGATIWSARQAAPAIPPCGEHLAYTNFPDRYRKSPLAGHVEFVTWYTPQGAGSGDELRPKKGRVPVSDRMRG